MPSADKNEEQADTFLLADAFSQRWRISGRTAEKNLTC